MVKYSVQIGLKYFAILTNRQIVRRDFFGKGMFADNVWEIAARGRNVEIATQH